MGLLLGIPSTVPDIDLFQEDAAGQGEALGEVRLLQALVLGVSAVCLPPCLNYSLHQLQATMAWVPTSNWLGLPPTLPSWVFSGCWGSHG